MRMGVRSHDMQTRVEEGMGEGGVECRNMALLTTTIRDILCVTLLRTLLALSLRSVPESPDEDLLWRLELSLAYSKKPRQRDVEEKWMTKMYKRKKLTYCALYNKKKAKNVLHILQRDM